MRNIDFDPLCLRTVDHALGASRLPVPHGNERVGDGGHFGVADGSRRLAVLGPVCGMPLDGNPATFCPRLSNRVDTGGTRSADEGRHLESRLGNRVVHERCVGLRKVATAGDDDAHVGGYSTGVHPTRAGVAITLLRHHNSRLLPIMSAPSAADLEKKKAGAKHVTTKTGSGLDPAAVAAMEKLYNDNGKDLAKAAKAAGITLKAGAKVKSGSDFAVQLLNGTLGE